MAFTVQLGFHRRLYVREPYSIHFARLSVSPSMLCCKAISQKAFNQETPFFITQIEGQ